MTINPQFLTTEEIQKRAPAAFATAPLAGASDRYSFMPTSQVVDLFRSEGWEPVKAVEHSVRLEGRRGFQAHMIRFARRDDVTRSFGLQEVRPELVLRNSHDRSAAFKIDGGLFRLVCLNGLVVSDTAFPGIALRHVDVAPEAFIKGAAAVVENTPRLLETVHAWQKIPLTPAARTEFATKALGVRWPTAEDRPAGVTASVLLTGRRFGDHAPDLWTTFNLVQENLVRGGAKFRNGRARSKIRTVKSPASDVAINKGLWSLAAEFSQN
jgi:hypothetical protein